MPILILAGGISLILQPIISRRRKKFTKDYKHFLRKNEGAEFFCYTDADVVKKSIEMHLIPTLAEKNIEVVKIAGRIPETTLNPQYVSHMLFTIRDIQFPTIIKITQGNIVDAALHDKFNEAVSAGGALPLIDVLDNSLIELREYVQSFED